MFVPQTDRGAIIVSLYYQKNRYCDFQMSQSDENSSRLNAFKIIQHAIVIH